MFSFLKLFNRPLAVLTLGSVFLVTQALAEDTVIVTGSSGKQSRIVGEVVDFTGERLLLRHPSGREETIKAARVVHVESDWVASHQQALQHIQTHSYDQALEALTRALREERRVWVQRRLLSLYARCASYVNQSEQAIGSFLLLYGDDPTTQYFDTIPLPWTAAQPQPGLQRRAEKWLAESEKPIERLIAASWLLSTAQRAQATAALRDLVDAPDARIIFLAEAQLWRTQVVSATPQDVVRWQERMERMPQAIRAGPCYLLALAQARNNQPDEAALMFMHIPILYPQQRGLAAESLLAAARQLEKMDRPKQARGLYREVIVDYAETAVTEQARQKYAELQKQGN